VDDIVICSLAIVIPRHGRACPGHPRLKTRQRKEDVDARDKRGHDGESSGLNVQYVARPPEMSNTAPVV
jgi:hypothetical protein